MNRLIIKSRVGADGVLHLDVPVGTADANREVQVTIDAISPPRVQTDWREFVDGIAGRWQGELERPEQGDYEKRDEFP